MSQSNSSEYGRSLFSEPRSAPDARMPPRDVGGPPARDNIPEFSVEELSGAIKQALERGFNRIRVRGEVSSVSRPGSGHIYLSFKQGRHVLRAVIWRSAAVRIATKPQEGIEYVATGRITSFSGTSVYQMVIERLVRSGEGEWLAMLEERKAKLRAEGLFDDAGKQKLPLIPKVVGVVSSPRGAAIQDILHRLRDRFPCHVLLWPVAVQGENCAIEVSAAIDGFNKIGPASSVPRPDVLIVARGGGSVEELFGFSEEIVVRAAHRSKIPLISAVGHETDTSLIDLAADVRAPTPTAAAELAVPVRSELSAKAASLDSRIIRGINRSLASRQQQHRNLSRALPTAASLIALPQQRMDQVAASLQFSLKSNVQNKRIRLAKIDAKLRLPASLRTAMRRLDRVGDSAERAMAGRMDRMIHRLEAVGKRARPGLISASVSRKKTELSNAARSAEIAVRARLRTLNDKLSASGRLVESLGYPQTLKRGFAVIRSGERVVVRQADACRAENLEIEFQDGRVPVALRNSASPPDAQ